MCSLQSRIHLPSLLPKRMTLIDIVLLNCIFSIPLEEKDKNFAFIVHPYNNSQPAKIYQYERLFYR